MIGKSFFTVENLMDNNQLKPLPSNGKFRKIILTGNLVQRAKYIEIGAFKILKLFWQR